MILVWSEDEIDCIEDLELSAALKDVTGSTALPEAVRDAEPDTPTFELCHEGGAHLFPFSARNGARGMFVSHSTEEDAYLVGLVSPGQKHCARTHLKISRRRSRETTTGLPAVFRHNCRNCHVYWQEVLIERSSS